MHDAAKPTQSIAAHQWVCGLLSLCALCALACVSCTAEQDDLARSAIDVVDEVGAPAYSLTRTLCTAAQWRIARDETRPVEARKADVISLRERCHVAYLAFEEVIQAKALAQAALDAGEKLADVAAKIATAKAALAKAMAAAHQLESALKPPAELETPPDMAAPGGAS